MKGYLRLSAAVVRLYLRDPLSVALSIALIVFMMVLFGVVMGDDQYQIRLPLAVLDEAGNPAARQLAARIGADGLLELRKVETEADAVELLRRAQVIGALVVEPPFTGRPGPDGRLAGLRLVVDDNPTRWIELGIQRLQILTAGFAGRRDGELWTREVRPIEVVKSRYIDFIFPGLLAMSIMQACLASGLVLLDARELGVLRRLRLTPLGSLHIFGGFITGRLFIVGLHLGVLTLVAVLGFQARILAGPLEALPPAAPRHHHLHGPRRDGGDAGSDHRVGQPDHADGEPAHVVSLRRLLQSRVDAARPQVARAGAPPHLPGGRHPRHRGARRAADPFHAAARGPSRLACRLPHGLRLRLPALAEGTGLAGEEIRVTRRSEPMTIEHQEIKQILRQRTPFLLVDRILEMDGERAVGIKNVTGTEPYLVGHFPDEPILPGVLLLEAMSQVGGILLAHDPRYKEKTRGYLAEVAKVKFKKFVIPGDQVVMEARKIALLASVARVEVRSTVAGVEVALGEISYAFA